MKYWDQLFWNVTRNFPIKTEIKLIIMAVVVVVQLRRLKIKL